MNEAAPKKNDPRMFTLISVLLVVAIVAAGWVLGVQPLIANAASAQTQAATQIQSNQALRVRLIALAKEAKQAEALKSQAASLAAAVPSTLDAKAFVREMNSLAEKRNLTVGSVAPGTPVAYTVPASIQAEQAAASAAATPAASASASATAVAVPASTVKPQAVADSQITSANFTVIPVTVQVTGTMAATLAFVKDLQTDNRLFLVSGYSASVSTSNTTTDSSSTASSAAAISTSAATTSAAASVDEPTATATGPVVYQATITGYLYALKSLS